MASMEEFTPVISDAVALPIAVTCDGAANIATLVAYRHFIASHRGFLIACIARIVTALDLQYILVTGVIGAASNNGGGCVAGARAMPVMRTYVITILASLISYPGGGRSC